MLQSLYNGISALQAHQEYLNVVSNNLANVNTIGYKSARTNFQDSLSQTYVPPTSAGANVAGHNGIQIGLGSSVGTVLTNFTQGSLQSTGVPSDVAIEGNGFLRLRDPAQAATYFYTRAGNLRVDEVGAQSFLVDANGMRVQGWNATAADTPNVAGGLVDMEVPPVLPSAGPPAVPATAQFLSYSIQSDGKIEGQFYDPPSVPFPNGQQITSTLGFIEMSNFPNPQALQKAGGNLYAYNAAAGTEIQASPGASGTGTIRAGYIEMSNVDMAQEFTDMIRAQRGLQANSRVITTSDEVIQELVQMKR